MVQAGTHARLRRRLAAGAMTAALVVGGALALGTTAASAATPVVATSQAAPTPAATAGAQKTTAKECFAKVPKSFREALRTLAKADAAKQPQMRADLVKAALAGTYGAEIKTRAEHVATEISDAPATLQSDLKATDALAGKDRTTALHKIYDDALKGTYGDAVQKHAKAVKAQLKDDKKPCERIWLRIDTDLIG